MLTELAGSQAAGLRPAIAELVKAHIRTVRELFFFFFCLLLASLGRPSHAR